LSPVPISGPVLAVRGHSTCASWASVSGLFFRNSVNYALPVVECPGIMAATTEGDILDIDLDSGAVVNTVTGSRLRGTPMPSFLQDIIASGGLLESLLRQGLVEAPAARVINAAGW